MKILVYAEQFRNGNWDVWEHSCSPNEINAVLSSALAQANKRSLRSKPTHDDFLEGARQLFDVALDPALSPRDGDTQVYCVCVDHLVIGVYEKIRQYSPKRPVGRELADAPLQMSA